MKAADWKPETMFNPVCALGGDQVDLYRGVVEEVRAHAGYAAGEPAQRRSHAEHVMQCLSASSPPTDWDLDGTVAPPALCSNDYGLYGGGVGNLLEAIVTRPLPSRLSFPLVGLVSKRCSL